MNNLKNLSFQLNIIIYPTYQRSKMFITLNNISSVWLANKKKNTRYNLKSTYRYTLPVN